MIHTWIRIWVELPKYCGGTSVMCFLTVKLRYLFTGLGKKCLYQSKIVVCLVAIGIKRCPTCILCISLCWIGFTFNPESVPKLTASHLNYIVLFGQYFGFLSYGILDLNCCLSWYRSSFSSLYLIIFSYSLMWFPFSHQKDILLLYFADDKLGLTVPCR